MQPASFEPHDHGQCVSTSLATAEARLAEKGARFTAARRKVLEILLADHRALGAYAIADELAKADMPSQPVAVYRALDFLVEHGLVHRIEGQNAFVACSHPEDHHRPVLFLVCSSCDAVAETPVTSEQLPLVTLAQEVGFEVEQTILEARGVCPNCRD